MNSSERGISIEWLLGMGLTFGLVLVDPEMPGWRILILVGIAVCFGGAMRKSQWIGRTSRILTLTGESFSDDGDAFPRKLAAYAFLALGVLLFGFVTWPIQYSSVPGDPVRLSGPIISQTEFRPWTPNGILPNGSVGGQAGSATPGSGAKGPGKSVKPSVIPPPTNLKVTRVTALPNPPTGLTAKAN